MKDAGCRCLRIETQLAACTAWRIKWHCHPMVARRYAQLPQSHPSSEPCKIVPVDKMKSISDIKNPTHLDWLNSCKSFGWCQLRNGRELADYLINLQRHVVPGKSHILCVFIRWLRRQWYAERAKFTVDRKHCGVACARVNNKWMRVIATEATEECLIDKEQLVDGKIFSK